MKRKNLASMSESISSKLLESMYLVNVLEDLAEGDAKETTILTVIKRHLKTAFYQTEACRKILM